MTLQISDSTKNIIEAIITIFETGDLPNPKSYASVCVMKGDTGHLSVGKCQTSLASGNLFILTKMYVDANGKFSTQFIPYLDRLKQCDTSLDFDDNLKSLYKQAGLNDPVIKTVQDAFFDKIYFDPSFNAANRQGVTTALGMAIVFDGFIQGSYSRIKNSIPNWENLAEKEFFQKYVIARKEWLTAKSPLLAKTVYRMVTFQKLIDTNNWDLNLPLVAHDVTITKEFLTNTINIANVPITSNATVPVSNGKAEESRLLHLTKPMMQGKDVTLLQQSLNNRGYHLTVDGVFGPAVDSAVRDYQSKQNLQSDGLVGNITRTFLGIDDEE